MDTHSLNQNENPQVLKVKKPNFMSQEIARILNNRADIFDYMPRIVKTNSGYDVPCKLPKIYKKWWSTLVSYPKFREIINGKIENLIKNMENIRVDKIKLLWQNTGLCIQLFPGSGVNSYVSDNGEYHTHNVGIIHEANILLLVLQLYIPELLNYIELFEKGSIKVDDNIQDDIGLGVSYEINLTNIRNLTLPYTQIKNYFPVISRVPGGFNIRCELPMVYNKVINILTNNDGFRQKVRKELGRLSARNKHDGLESLDLIWYEYALDFNLNLNPGNILLECHPDIAPYHYSTNAIRSYDHVLLLQNCLQTYLKILWDEIAKYSLGKSEHYTRDDENSVFDGQDRIITNVPLK